jgi:hypothetical protein
MFEEPTTADFKGVVPVFATEKNPEETPENAISCRD